MEKTKRFNVIDFVIVFALFMIIIISFVRSGDADYQLIHEIYYYVGASALMLVILWQRKAKIFNIVTLVFLLCLGLGLLYYMWNNRRNWGFEYDLFLSTKGMMYGLFVIFLIDVIKKREESLKHLFNNRLFAIVTVITLIGMSTINIQGIFSVICPFIMLYLTYIEKDRLRVLFLYLSFAIYSVFLMYFIYSLLFCRAETINGRYSGCFRYLMNAAMLSSGALLAVIYSFDYFYAIAKKKAGLVIVSLAAVALPTAAELFTRGQNSFNRLVGGRIYPFDVLFSVGNRVEKEEKYYSYIAYGFCRASFCYIACDFNPNGIDEKYFKR